MTVTLLSASNCISAVLVINKKSNLATGKSQKVLKVALYSNIEIDKCLTSGNSGLVQILLSPGRSTYRHRWLSSSASLNLHSVVGLFT